VLVKNLKFWLGPARADFLWMDVACVLLGVGTALTTAHEISLWYLLLAFIGALAAHVSVNALNEYFDFKSGLDLASERTPFSGGSGTLRERPEMARVALVMGLGALALAGVIGLFFVWKVGWGLFPLGILGLVTIVLYTPWLTRVPALNLLATGFGFGLLMINGVNYVLTGHYTWPSFFGSLVMFFQGNALLLLNQYPDVEVDRTVGRRNLPIVYGRRASSWVYGVLLMAVYASLLAGVVLKHGPSSVPILPWPSLILFLTFPLAVMTVIGARRHADDLPGLARYLGYNAVLNVVNPTLVGLGLVLAAVL
jgi:1,4-dihydroxy-2-naphthoate octaprenyltransferase